VLLDLRIRDLAIIDDLRLGFGRGFNVISGETGAGKSIILHALGLALGGRASADVVRAGAKAAHVEASFEPGDEALALVDEQDIPWDDGEPLVLRRVVAAGGRSRSYVNGTAVTAATLRSLGVHLVDYASQHESAVLLDEARHREILDRFADHGPLVERVRTQVEALREARSELAALRETEERRRSELELLRYQREELDEAAPREGEEAELERELAVLQQAEQLRDVVSRAERSLYSGAGAAIDQVGSALAGIGPFAELDEEMEQIQTQIQEAHYALEDSARALSRVAGRLHEDPRRVEELEERREVLRALQRKHRTDEAGLVARLEGLATDIERLEGAAERADGLAERVDALEVAATASGEELTGSRRRAGEGMAGRVAAALEQLAMGGATFQVGVDADPSGLGTDGADLVGFRLSANPGEPARPLARVASGGELSRVLLALKEVLQDRGYAGSFVLDEIDSGIGGTTADVVGRKLEALARGRQLIAITHLPQIAARAGSHVVVGKREQEGRTRVWAERLSEEARVDELARMVAGDQHTDRSRALAGEMLQGSSARTGRDGVVE